MLHFRKAKQGDEIEGMLASGLLKEDRRDLIMVVLDEEELAGVCGMKVEGGTGEINSIYIHEGYRGSGIGSGLVKSILFAADRMGVSQVQVPLKEGIGAFFRRLGFESVKENPQVLSVNLQGYFGGCHDC